MNFVKQVLGPWKFKGSMSQIISNKGNFIVVKEIKVSKVYDANNKMAVELLMPDPKEVEVISRARTVEILKEALPKFKKFDANKPEDLRHLNDLVESIIKGTWYEHLELKPVKGMKMITEEVK